MMIQTEAEKRARRETLRWLILLALSRAASVGSKETQLLYVLGAAEGIENLTRAELRDALTYLQVRDTITLESGDHVMHWHAKLNRYGFDIVEYTVPCEPGIARPPQEWT